MGDLGCKGYFFKKARQFSAFLGTQQILTATLN
jgi:hypothetical protein